MIEDDENDKPEEAGDGFDHLDADHPSRDRPYDVGKNKPPVKNRFAKGVSGNPKGKKKGRHITSMMREVILAPTTIRKRDGNETVPSIVATLMVVTQKANGGDIKAADRLFKTADQLSLFEVPPEEDDPDDMDDQIMNDLVKRIRGADGE